MGHQGQQDMMKTPVERYGLSVDPWQNFATWFAEAEATEPFPANVMSIATVDGSGRPSLRCVLLKEVLSDGLCFYTNYESKKGQDLASNPHIAVLFHWPKLERQVRVEGVVEKLSRDKAETYFHSRPRGSQISAAVSAQSRPISGRSLLEERATKLEEELVGKTVPLPAYWGGYKIIPSAFEFWQGLPSRMHDRVVFSRQTAQQATWNTEILAP